MGGGPQIGHGTAADHETAASGAGEGPSPAYGLLRDGEVVRLRPIGPGDSGRLVEFHEGLSEETVYRRFFNAHPHLRDAEIRRFTTVDHRDRVAIVAEAHGRLQGVARYDRLGGGPTAEVAFVVADSVQGRGLGTLLLEHLALAARQRGISSFAADTLASNEKMQAVFRRTGFARRLSWCDGLVHVEFPIGPTQGYLDALLTRHSASLRSRLKGLPRPEGTEDVRVVCPTRAAAGAAKGALAGAGVGDAGILVGEIAAGLACILGDGADTPLIVDASQLRLRRRFMTVARAAAGRVPLVVVDPDGIYASVCAQAGVPAETSWEGALARLRTDLPVPGRRARLVDFEPSDPGRARKVLDAAAGEGSDPVELATSEAEDVLGAYGLAVRPPVALSADARAGPPSVSALRTRRSRPGRFAPLTDLDAEYLAGTEPVTAVRVARLIDDNPELLEVEVGPDAPPRIVLGRRRTVLDDPFARRVDTGEAFPRLWRQRQEGEE